MFFITSHAHSCVSQFLSHFDFIAFAFHFHVYSIKMCSFSWVFSSSSSQSCVFTIQWEKLNMVVYIVVLFVSRCCLHHFLLSCFSPAEEKMISQTETLMKKLLLLNLHRNPHTQQFHFWSSFFPTILSSFDYTSTRKHIKHWNMFFKIFHNCFGSLSLSSHS